MQEADDRADFSSGSDDDAAAFENEAMQEMVAVLQDPSIYSTLGMTHPPKSFHPLEPEAYAASFVRLVQ